MTHPTPALPEELSALFARADELAAQLDAPLSAAAGEIGRASCRERV